MNDVKHVIHERKVHVMDPFSRLAIRCLHIAIRYRPINIMVDCCRGSRLRQFLVKGYFAPYCGQVSNRIAAKPLGNVLGTRRQRFCFDARSSRSPSRTNATSDSTSSGESAIGAASRESTLARTGSMGPCL